MQKLLVFYLLFLLGIASVQAGGDISPPSSTDKIEEKTDIYLLGTQPKDDKSVNNTYTVDSNGQRASAKSFTAGIDDTVVVHLSVEDQRKIFNTANCLDQEGKEKKDCTKRNIALYLNGRNIGERKSNELINANYIEFKLGYQDDKDYSNKQKWQELLGSPTWGKGFFEKQVTVTFGIADTTNSNELITVNNDKFYLRRISWWKFFTGLMFLSIMMYAIFKYAPHTGLLRNGDKDTQWSLARCQMAFWFVLIIFSFLFVWGITGAMDTITSQTLVMMGLSSGTLLASALIEVSRDDNKGLDELATAIQKYIAQNTSLDAQLAINPNAALKALRDENDRRLTAYQKEIERLSTADTTKGNFWLDILSDPSGNPALHRFQVVAWTVVLGFIFVFSVWKYLSMPAFSDTLLALMGLSSVTYLGFKVPENNQ